MTSHREPTWNAIFDWDGVIIDSSKAHEASWDRLAEVEHRDLPTGHFLEGFGRKNDFIIPHILNWTDDPAEIQRLSLRKEEVYREIVRERGQEPLPGVREWLETLRDRGVPCAIGSSTHRANIELILDLAGLRDCFQQIVTGDDVKRGKPDPEVFLTAAAKLGAPSERCVVFEDALVGIAAAKAARMRVVAVATTHTASELHDADLVTHRLDSLDFDALSGWFPPADSPAPRRP